MGKQNFAVILQVLVYNVNVDSQQEKEKQNECITEFEA